MLLSSGRDLEAAQVLDHFSQVRSVGSLISSHHLLLLGGVTVSLYTNHIFCCHKTFSRIKLDSFHHFLASNPHFLSSSWQSRRRVSDFSSTHQKLKKWGMCWWCHVLRCCSRQCFVGLGPGHWCGVSTVRNYILLLFKLSSRKKEF